jgi:hypothetical protein
MDIYARRRARLALLVEQKANGNVAEFARIFSYSRSQISQFLSETYNGGRSIGERAARTIDERVGNPPGWLDLRLSESEKTILSRPFSTAELRVATGKTQPIDSSPSASYLARIPVRYHMEVDSNGNVENFKELGSWAIKFLDYYSPHGLGAILIKGQGLRPRVKGNEYLIVDGGHQPRPGDDVLVGFKNEKIAVMQLLYEREGELAFGSINGGAATTIVNEADIEGMDVIVSVAHSGTPIHEQET